MNKIYTKKGDNGTTSLVGGKRIKKNDVLLDAYGMADELNAFIGAVIAENNLPILTDIQRNLFIVGGILATEEGERNQFWGEINLDKSTENLECEIDRMSETIPPFKGFILPQGSSLIAKIHICRTICRKLERKMVTISETRKDISDLLKYVNRLSDYFFILAEFQHKNEKVPIIYWK